MLIKCLLDAYYDYYGNLQAAQTTLEVFFFEFISESSARTPFINSDKDCHFLLKKKYVLKKIFKNFLRILWAALNYFLVIVHLNTLNTS